jgi:hypothetical protein
MAPLSWDNCVVLRALDTAPIDTSIGLFEAVECRDGRRIPPLPTTLASRTHTRRLRRPRRQWPGARVHRFPRQRGRSPAPGGGISADGSRWIWSRSNFFVHVKVLARLFRGKFLAMLIDAHSGGRLKFLNTYAGLADKKTFKKFLAPLRRIKWVVYCKDPFGGPEQVLRYLSRYTHRTAISNRRLVAADNGGVSFRWKDYRIEGPGRWKTMTLTPHEFIRRFLLHVLPRGFHRIRHYGLFASTNRAESIATARGLLDVAVPTDPQKQSDVAPDAPRVLACPCSRCGARMIVIEVFAPGCEPRWRPTPSRIDTS